jgi:predicted nucleic acid-binding protein
MRQQSSGSEKRNIYPGKATDCASFVVMKELRLLDALATDKHFRIAGI